MKPTDKQKKEHKGTENLKPYKKGQSGNPKGRPKKGSAIADLLNMIGDEKVKIEFDGIEKEMTKREAVMRVIYIKAMQGDPASINFMADRTEGKAIERIEKKDVYEFDYELSELSKLTPDELIREYNKALEISDN